MAKEEHAMEHNTFRQPRIDGGKKIVEDKDEKYKEEPRDEMKKPKLDAIETFCCSKGVRLAKILSTPFDTYVRSGLGKKRLKCLKASLKEWGASLDR